MSLELHFSALDGFEEADRWKPLKLINNWQPHPWLPPEYQVTPKGQLVMRGNVVGGDPGKPQAVLPFEHLPEFEDGTDRREFYYWFEGQRTYRVTIFRNGEVLVEENNLGA